MYQVNQGIREFIWYGFTWQVRQINGEWFYRGRLDPYPGPTVKSALKDAGIACAFKKLLRQFCEL